MEIKQSIIEIKDLSCGYLEKNILSHLSFNVKQGEIFCILGSNGVGKTTLFKTLLGFLERQQGQIEVDGVDISNMNRAKLAQQIAYVPQAHTPPFPYSVEDVVLMGRTARFEHRYGPQKKDRKKVEEILEDLEISFLKDKIYTEISGGERQMVLIARALAQEPLFLLMDEPTSNLDFGNQIRVLKQIKALQKKGMGIIMTTHAPDHAFLCSAKVLLINQKKEYTIGKSEEVLTGKNLKESYGADIDIIDYMDHLGKVRKSCAINL